MKKFIIIIGLFTLLLPLEIFAQEASSSPSASSAPASQDSQEVSLAKKLLIGFDLSGGFSKPVSGNFPDGSISIKFSFGGAAVLHYYITNTVGIAVNIGYHHFASDETDSDGLSFHRFKLHYLFVSFMPIIRFEGIYFAFGMYMGFPLKANYDGTNPNILNNTSYYTTPDIGFQFKAGYIFKLANKVEMYAGIEIKNQLSSFYANTEHNGRIFSIYANLGLLFGVK